MGFGLSSIKKLLLKPETEIVIQKAWIMTFSKNSESSSSSMAEEIVWSTEQLPKLSKFQRRTKAGVKKRHKLRAEPVEERGGL